VIKTGIGTSVRSAISSVIDVIGSTVIITPYTISSSDSGYSGQIPTDGTPVSLKAIPYEEFKKITKEKFGNLESGGMQLALKYDAVFDISSSTKYKITYNSEVYDIIEPKRYAIEDTLVAWIISISKRID